MSEKPKNEEKKVTSPTGNRTPASRVTGGDTDHYTIEDIFIVVYIIEVFREYGQLIEDEAPESIPNFIEIAYLQREISQCSRSG